MTELSQELIGLSVSIDMSNGEPETTFDRIFARVVEVTTGPDGQPVLLCELSSDNRTSRSPT